MPWLILFLPLLSVAVITLFTLRSKTVSSLISIGAVVTGFMLTLLFINANGFQFSGELPCNWLSIVRHLADCKLISVSSSTP